MANLPVFKEVKSAVTVDLAAWFILLLLIVLLSPALREIHQAFVAISVATKYGFISRALLGGQHLEQKRKIAKSWTSHSL